MPEAITLIGHEGQKIQLPTGLFIGNDFVSSVNGTTLDVYNPYSGNILGTVSSAEAVDIDNAVAYAERALPSWRGLPGAEKGRLLYRLGTLIERDVDELASIQAVDAGLAYDDVKNLDTKIAIAVLRHFGGWADKISGRVTEVPNGTGYVRREPIGICGMIIPWNAPLMITCWKLGPALAAGNVVIIKVPELAPLYGQKLASLIVEAGFPPGVVGIVNGLGPIAGRAIAEHMQIRKVSFTGSTKTGRAILRSAADSNLKKVTLELGGKGPAIVFKDANLANATFWTSLSSSANNGQICVLGSRIYVQDDIYNEFIELFQAHRRQNLPRVGNPVKPGVGKGPIISRSQHNRIMEYIETGKAEGARVLLGGRKLQIDDEDILEGKENKRGGFIENTIFVDVTEDMTIVKEEIFGPVATIHRFVSEKEVIEKANASQYGLSASVYTSSIDRARRVSDALQTGQVTINCWGTPCVNMPFGGIKASGFGCDMGVESLDEWTTCKSIYHWHLDD